ncbi:MAG: methyltransferase [Candidatus Latescibacterota bacterium]
MKIQKTLRLQIGIVAGLIFIWRAHPTLSSFCAGLIFMALGECFRFVSAGTLIKFEGVTRNGIYSFTRNPLYVGSFLIGLGACIMGKDIPFFLLFILLFPSLYYRVIKEEESYLTGRYGEDYINYLNEVPRLLPHHFDLGMIIRDTSPFLAVKNRELITLAGLITVLVIMVIKMVMA